MKYVKYKGSMLRRGILTGAMVLAGAGATVAAGAAPAGASNTQMVAAGSATTFFMVHALFPAINDINPNPEIGTETQSIAPDSETCSGGVNYTSSSTAVPPNGSGAGKKALAAEETAASTEQGCIDFSRSSSPPAPATETLELSATTESGDPSPSSLDYYAYALDGVGPLVGSDAPTSVRTAGSDTGASKGLTLAQLQAIYECSPSARNWDQITVNGVTGQNAPIALFWPQSGSGTRAVMTDVLGFDPSKYYGVSPSVCTATTQPITSFGPGGAFVNEENTEDGIIYQNSIGDANAAGGAIPADTTSPPPVDSVAAAAIYLYSAGKFSQQWNDPTDYSSTHNNYVQQEIDGASSPDNTLGNFLAGTLTFATVRSTGGSGEAYVDLTAQTGPFNQNTNRGTYGIDGNTVSEANEWYHQLPVGSDPSDSAATIPGVRYVYNVADSLLPGYNGAKDLMGFDNQPSGTNSALCNGDDASTISAQGFLPLTNGAGGAGGLGYQRLLLPGVPGLELPGSGYVHPLDDSDLRQQKPVSVSVS